MALAERNAAETSTEDHLGSKHDKETERETETETETENEKNATVTTTAEPSVEPVASEEYITGVRLLLVFVGVVLTCFLMLLDTSIIVTVSTVPVV